MMARWIGTLADGGVIDPPKDVRDAADTPHVMAQYVVGEERLQSLMEWFAAADPVIAQRERRAAVEVCIWMAHADREVHPEERFMLQQIVTHSGLDDDTQDALVDAIHAPPPLDGLEERLTQPVLRELMMALAWELALSDGHVDESESHLFGELANRFKVSRERAAELRALLSQQVR